VTDQNSPLCGGADDLLCFSVYSTGLAFNRVYKPLLDELGLTYPQYLVMVALWNKDDRTVGSLGDELFLESNTLTPLLKRIEAIGLITRKRDPKDERVVRVRLTPQGAALKERYSGIRSCIFDATGLSDAEMASLHDAMRKLRRHLRQTVT
jgi:DNA-binding MarR family transcriptional regulator